MTAQKNKAKPIQIRTHSYPVHDPKHPEGWRTGYYYVITRGSSTMKHTRRAAGRCNSHEEALKEAQEYLSKLYADLRHYYGDGG